MKKLFFVCLALLVAGVAQAQEFKFGLKLGAGTTTASLKKSVTYTGETSSGSFKDIKVDQGNLTMGFHAGVTTRLSLGNIVVLPEAYFSSVSNDMKLTDIQTGEVSNVTNTMTRLDIPVLAGVKLAKMFRVNAGPIGSLTLKQRSGVAVKLAELLSGEQIEDDPTKFTFGFQAGAGLDISRLSIDLRYESNLSWLGSGIVVSNQTRSFDTRSRQVLLSIAILF